MDIQIMVDTFDPTASPAYQEIATTAIKNMAIALTHYRLYTKNRFGDYCP